MLPNLRKTYSIPNLLSLEEYGSFSDGEVDAFWVDEATADLSKYTKLEELKKNFPDFLGCFDNLSEFPFVVDNKVIVEAKPTPIFNALKTANMVRLRPIQLLREDSNLGPSP